MCKKHISLKKMALIKITDLTEKCPKKLIYLEALSRAIKPISNEIAITILEKCTIPTSIGKVFQTRKTINQASKNSANLIAIAAAFEEEIEISNTTAFLQTR
jgi:heptaprenylglyceryl phosphate synthase